MSVEFSRQEYWSGLPCPPPGDLPNPGVEPGPPALKVAPLPSDRRLILMAVPVCPVDSPCD